MTARGPVEWYFIDFDERRRITVKIEDMDLDEEKFDETLKHAKAVLTKIQPSLAPEITFVHLTFEGDLISAMDPLADPLRDHTQCPYYPPLELIQGPEEIRTIVRTDLRELDRLAVNVDLVSYQTASEPASTTRAVFKYYFDSRSIEEMWDELNLWIRLPSHPNIVPFDRVVLDEHYGNVVGFTNLYIPGGTLEENRAGVFKLKWLQQLMQVVDDLNLRWGIWHQDIVPRNLLIDSATDNLMLFDFNYSKRLGYERPDGRIGHWEPREDVRAVLFTVYEIITRDFHFRHKSHWEELDSAMVEDIEWKPHPDVKLDHPVSEFRGMLNAWLKKRKEGKQITFFKDAPEYIDWPELEKPLVETHYVDQTVLQPSFILGYRRDAERKGWKVIKWQRPPQRNLPEWGDYHLLENGEFKEPSV